eukprot:2238070-Pleurochrysis_carterae.AAC.3
MGTDLKVGVLTRRFQGETPAFSCPFLGVRRRQLGHARDAGPARLYEETSGRAGGALRDRENQPKQQPRLAALQFMTRPRRAVVALQSPATRQNTLYPFSSTSAP